MRFLTKKRVKSHVLETIIGSLMVVFAALAIYILIVSSGATPEDQINESGINGTSDQSGPSPESAVIEILIVIILAILAQTILLIKIFEQKQRN